MEYSEQTRKLLGLSHAQLPLSDYLALGISSEHVNELIHMATDPKLLDAEEDPVFWAAVHAWYALGQLKVTEAIGPLLDLMEKYPYDRLFDVDLSKVFVLMGKDAIPVLRDYLWDTSRFEDSRGFTFHCLEQLGLIYRQPCLEVVVEFLQRFDKDSKVLNSFAMCSLIELEAVEYITTIREAFQQDCVDIDIPGDLEDVEIDLGLRAKRDTPEPHYNYQSPGMLQQFDAHRQNREYDAYPDNDRESEPVRLPPKVGRNDPCPCGSGKKFKKCCLH